MAGRPGGAGIEFVRPVTRGDICIELAVWPVDGSVPYRLAGSPPPLAHHSIQLEIDLFSPFEWLRKFISSDYLHLTYNVLRS